ncbi:hypothetical protein C0993_006674 [Termitomyces sp. T159_Od127]|nr:hypothetical protein C0993_006674 [Termitomyces sp. T159_Od127]
MIPVGDLRTSSAVSITQRDQDVVKRSTDSLSKERSDYEDPEVRAKSGWSSKVGSKVRPFILPALALVILGWWISATVLKATRHRWPTVIVGLFLQQAIALFVLKSRAGFDIFNWIATLAADFLSQGSVGAGFFFDAEVIAKHWFFVNTVSHVTMTSGFSTIAGSVLIAYINLGVPPQNLVTSSVMSIPASISISKLRLPETEEPVTRGNVTVDRGEKAEDKPANSLHAFSRGAVFGLVVAGQILTNVLTVLSLVAAINGLLTWIGRGFGIHHLTLDLIIGYIFYPVTFFLSVPRDEILRVSQLFATKLVANEFAAYVDLQAMMKSNPLSPRAYTIASYGLCGFANLGSLGIQVGVLSALAPSRGRVIAQIALSAMICGFLSTLQTAGIVGMLV